MSSREMTLSDVKKKFKEFCRSDMALQDVFSLCRNFKSLKPKDPEKFVLPNGAEEKCVAIKGTIPVRIRDQQYNIPISIWLRPAYPSIFPFVYVTPTPEMGINQSKYVDHNGRVYLPYITDWKQGSSDLTTLVQIMRGKFSEKCPVFTHRPHPYNPFVKPPSKTDGRPPYPQNVPYSQPQPPAAYGTQPYPVVFTARPTVMPNYPPPPTITNMQEVDTQHLQKAIESLQQSMETRNDTVLVILIDLVKEFEKLAHNPSSTNLLINKVQQIQDLTDEIKSTESAMSETKELFISKIVSSAQQLKVGAKIKLKYCTDLKDWLAEVNTLITSAVELVTNIEQLLKAAELDKLQSKTKSLSISSDPHREVPTCTCSGGSLEMSDLSAVSKFLEDLDSEEVIRLGVSLGLSFSKLKRMTMFPEDAIAAWLRGDDDVRKTSWASLAQALSDKKHTNIAGRIREEKLCGLQFSLTSPLF